MNRKVVALALIFILFLSGCGEDAWEGTGVATNETEGCSSCIVEQDYYGNEVLSCGDFVPVGTSCFGVRMGE